MRLILDWIKFKRAIAREQAHMNRHEYIMSLGAGNGECDCE